MFQRALLVLEPDGLGSAATSAVIAVATKGHASVRVVAISPTAGDAGRLSRVGARLKLAVAQVTSEGLSADGRFLEARGGEDAAASVVAAAREFDADLIALGHKGRGNASALLKGSLGRRVAAAIDTPVLLVRGRQGTSALVPIRRILVPVDISDASRASVRIAGTLAHELHASVRLLHALVPQADLPRAALAQEGARLVQELGDTLRSAAVEFDTLIAEPSLNPVGAIWRAAGDWPADLILMSSRRFKPLVSLLLGSVAHGVLQHVSAPVLLLDSAPMS